MDHEQLRECIARAQRGNGEAFEELLKEYAARLYGYFYRATGRHHDAEDLLGEMTLRLVRTLKTYDDHGRFEPWLFRVAANMVRDRIRRFRNRPSVVSLSSDEDAGRSLDADLPADGPAVDAGIRTEEASQELQEALGKLDETTRQMVLLRHFGDMSFKDIAAMFQCPLGTALAKVHRGLKALRHLMGEEE